MTFIGSTRATGDLRPAFVRRKVARPGPTLRRADEDGARQALGADLATPGMVAAGAAIEHLARIALG